MALWPQPADEAPPLALDEISREVHAFAPGGLPAWEAGYLEYHRRRYQDTLRLLPPGGGRRLLDVGSFPGHLSALAQARGWEVVGLNNAIEGAGSWTDFLDRCTERKIAILGCEVEREPFPLPTASVDAVLFCELFEHLHLNPFHTLKEIFRVLRPGGLLVLTTPNLRRIETLSRLWHGWGAQPPLSRTFRELFPSLLYHRHNREYTANELAYYLALQGKDLYDFRLDRVYYSDALDAAHEIPGILGQRVGAGEQRLAALPAAPGARASGASSWRAPGARTRPWSSGTSLRAVEGFGPLEDDERPTQGFTRRLTFPFRRAGARAGFEVPLPAGDGPALVSLVVANPDDDAPTLRDRVDARRGPGGDPRPRASPRAVRVHLLVPAPVAARGAVRVGAHHGDAARSRARAAGRPSRRRAVGARGAPGRARGRPGRDRARRGRAARGGPARFLVVRRARALPGRRAVPPRASRSGPGTKISSARAGSGGRTGARSASFAGRAVRRPPISGTRAAPPGFALRVYSGEPRLGPATGRISVERAGPDGLASRIGEAPFALSPDTWAELAVPFVAPAGPVRVTVETTPPRVPRALLPGSSDDRALGLAVKRIWLA